MKKTHVICLFILAAALAGCGATPSRQRIVVTAKEVAYSPATITLRLGQRVQVDLRNTGSVEHDFNIQTIPLDGEATTTGGLGGHGGDHADADAHVAALPGTTASITFTPREAGEYEFNCTVAGHKESGMTGKLIVQDK